MTAPSTSATPQNDGKDGNTTVQQGNDSAPRLPHENDQTAENQDTPDGKPTAEGKQAHKDIESGQVDTDRGAVTDRVYNDKLKK